MICSCPVPRAHGSLPQSTPYGRPLLLFIHQVLEAIERRVCPPVGSWWVLGDGAVENGAKPKTELSGKWHNHIDAESDETLLRILREVAALAPHAQQKVYPISHLQLGPQCRCREFEAVYRRLPNFHPLRGAVDEAFATGMMGEAGMDYEMVKATLEVCARHTRQASRQTMMATKSTICLLLDCRSIPLFPTLPRHRRAS